MTPEKLQPVALRVNDAAKLTGVSDRTVWDLIRKGYLPSLRIGTRVLVPYSALVDFVTSRSDKTGAHTRPEAAIRIAQANRARSHKGATT